MAGWMFLSLYFIAVGRFAQKDRIYRFTWSLYVYVWWLEFYDADLHTRKIIHRRLLLSCGGGCERKK
jgi:hypothetical protein